MKPEPPTFYSRTFRRPPTRKQQLQDAAMHLSQACDKMKAAGYTGADLALNLTEKASRQLQEDIAVTDA